MEKKINNISFEKYSKTVREYMDNLVQCLQSDYKSIPASWVVSLYLIADNYEIYLKAKKDVDDNGIRVVNSRGTYIVNPSFNVMNTCQNHMQKMVSSFALTPLSRSKMKALDTSQDMFDELTA